MVTLGQKIYRGVIFLLYNFLSSSVPVPPSAINRTVHPHETLNISQQIVKYGYAVEEHRVQTADGYILTMFRIQHHAPQNTHQMNNTSTSSRPPVLLMHGFLSSALDFVLMGPELSLAYQLVESGYDIWLGNCRGNTYSRKHVKYNPEGARFWQFSFHEIGYYDIPAKIDHITKVTGHEKIFYIGHSQGATTLFVTASERREYIKRIKLFVALAPVVYASAMPNILAQVAATFYKPIEWFVDTFEYYEFLPHWELQTQLFRLFCQNGMPYARLCHVFMHVNLGYSTDISMDLLPLILTSFPAGVSSRQLLHYVQNKRADSFAMYDHGFVKNMRLYGHKTPPKYNIQTKLKTALIYSDNDWLSTEKDVDRISLELKNLRMKYKMPEGVAHGDYLYGNKTLKLLMSILLDLLQQTERTGTF